MTTKPNPLDLQAVIPDKASAIAFDGGAGDKCRVIFDIYEADRAEVLKLLDMRGERLVLRIWREEDLQRMTEELQKEATQ